MIEFEILIEAFPPAEVYWRLFSREVNKEAGAAVEARVVVKRQDSATFEASFALEPEDI